MCTPIALLRRGLTLLQHWVLCTARAVHVPCGGDARGQPLRTASSVPPHDGRNTRRWHSSAFVSHLTFDLLLLVKPKHPVLVPHITLVGGGSLISCLFLMPCGFQAQCSKAEFDRTRVEYSPCLVFFLSWRVCLLSRPSVPIFAPASSLCVPRRRSCNSGWAMDSLRRYSNCACSVATAGST
jgi:hypothetical protein